MHCKSCNFKIDETMKICPSCYTTNEYFNKSKERSLDDIVSSSEFKKQNRKNQVEMKATKNRSLGFSNILSFQGKLIMIFGRSKTLDELTGAEYLFIILIVVFIGFIISLYCLLLLSILLGMIGGKQYPLNVLVFLSIPGIVFFMYKKYSEDKN